MKASPDRLARRRARPFFAPCCRRTPNLTERPPLAPDSTNLLAKQVDGLRRRHAPSGHQRAAPVPSGAEAVDVIEQRFARGGKPLGLVDEARRQLGTARHRPRACPAPTRANDAPTPAPQDSVDDLGLRRAASPEAAPGPRGLADGPHPALASPTRCTRRRALAEGAPPTSARAAASSSSRTAEAQGNHLVTARMLARMCDDRAHARLRERRT